MIGGASLAGGLASATSTWVAAFALTLLTQMLRVLGLSTAWQYAVYGVAIAAGMVISGDRIVGVFGGLLQRPARSRMARQPTTRTQTIRSRKGGMPSDLHPRSGARPIRPAVTDLLRRVKS